jgi:hypothetical protein
LDDEYPEPLSVIEERELRLISQPVIADYIVMRMMSAGKFALRCLAQIGNDNALPVSNRAPLNHFSTADLRIRAVTSLRLGPFDDFILP